MMTCLRADLRQSWLHRALTFMVLVSLVTIEIVGGYYSSVPPA
ncbi:hypothetical protein ACIQVE_27680 [Pseudomonas sp. NPDC098747]